MRVIWGGLSTYLVLDYFVAEKMGGSETVVLKIANEGIVLTPICTLYIGIGISKG